MTETGWQRIGQLAKLRREQMKLNQDELAPYGGPKVATVGKFERASQDQFPTRTQVQIEHALNWPAGTIKRVVAAIDSGERLDPEDERSLIHDDLPSNRVPIKVYREDAKQWDEQGIGDEDEAAMRGLLMLLRLIPEDFRQEAVTRAADAIVSVKVELDADELAERRVSQENLSEPQGRQDPALVADDQDEWAREQESQNEP